MDDGQASKAAHLRQAYKQMGKKLEEAAPSSSLPPEVKHVWTYFNELSSTRARGFSLPGPITFNEILSWCVLHGIELEPWEITTIRSLDQIWMKVVNGRLSRTQSSNS